MKTFLQRFAAVVWGVLSGFDRVVFKGRLPQLPLRFGRRLLTWGPTD